MAQYTFYTDPSHGWLEVPETDILAAGLADKISSYSYIDPAKRLVYLEEDCDAPLFMRAVGLKPSDLAEVYQDESFIRDLPKLLSSTA